MDYDLYFEQALNAVAKYNPETQFTILNLVLEQIEDEMSVKYIEGDKYQAFSSAESLLYNV